MDEIGRDQLLICEAQYALHVALARLASGNAASSGPVFFSEKKGKQRGTFAFSSKHPISAPKKKTNHLTKTPP